MNVIRPHVYGVQMPISYGTSLADRSFNCLTTLGVEQDGLAYEPSSTKLFDGNICGKSGRAKYVMIAIDRPAGIPMKPGSFASKCHEKGQMMIGIVPHSG